MGGESIYQYEVREQYIRRAEGTAVAFVRALKHIPWAAVVSAIDYPTRYEGVERREVLRRVAAAVESVPRPNPARMAAIRGLIESIEGHLAWTKPQKDLRPLGLREVNEGGTERGNQKPAG